jgi:hypothetical protein
MPGGLMQLLAVGAQDQYITVSPEMTYFKQKYKRPTNFSMQSVETTFVSTPPLTVGSRLQYTCKIPRVGDLLKDTFLALQLPDIYVQKNQTFTYDNNGKPVVTGQPPFRWIPKIGNYIVYTYSLIADTTVLDQKWGEFDDVWNDLTMPLNKLTTYNRMIGNEANFEIPNVYKKNVVVFKNNQILYNDYPYAETSTTPSISGRRLYIPLNFWFSKSPDLALPLVSLQYQVVTITIEFRMLEELFQFYDPINKIYISPTLYRSLYGGTWAIGDYFQLISPDNITGLLNKKTTLDLTPYLECNYVFLDTPERTYIATNSFDYLIENVYRTETSGIQNIYTIDLHIANPIKEILWITRRTDIFNYNDWANLTAAIPQDNTQSALSTAKILWNGIDRFDIKSARYFNLLQPYQYHTASPREGIYTYSFALEPEKIQPSGSFNASTINKTQLYITMNPYTRTDSSLIDGPGKTEYTVIVYSIYYNIFRVMSGSGAMVFAS